MTFGEKVTVLFLRFYTDFNHYNQHHSGAGFISTKSGSKKKTPSFLFGFIRPELLAGLYRPFFHLKLEESSSLSVKTRVA